MLSLIPGLPARAPLTVLCIGAHADDIEIGCAGTLFSLLGESRRITLHWVVMAASEARAREARTSANRILRRAAASTLTIERFQDGYLPYEGKAVKAAFERLKPLAPDLIFSHFRHDAHQDHRQVSELTWNTFRNHLILEYEIPKYDGDVGQPNVFVPITGPIRRRKLTHLMASFPSQRVKSWYTESTFDAMLRLRGVECGAPDGYAEAFHSRKIVLGGRPTHR
jgi:LmbE family N-acetylglucosaminyl deacetylase